MKKILLVLAFMFVSSIAMAQSTIVPEVSYAWTPPEAGTPVEYYVIQLQTNGGDWIQVATTSETSGSFVNILEYGKTYRIRIAGVDAQDRQEPFSLPSNEYTPDAGAPSAPGTPVWILE